IARQGREDRDAFLVTRASVIAAFATHIWLQFNQFEWQLMREPLAVFGKAFRHPAGHSFANGNQACAHAAPLLSNNTRAAPRLPPLPRGERIEVRAQSCGSPHTSSARLRGVGIVPVVA